ncbi:hypothetical protein [Brevibacillus laterosporus]|uniref:Uncharacterized protein n=1 Tax=Brevibacillus laterosporus TaxID=1465 RepID=A0AAP3DIT3_BRELA|nr:hypothetical protein [Brevibacillus laterosporus]MCR8981622.1 hypothetical protein [Brevibacillus laterosporus]MCZ0808777.1 hypothetical protein [Brevibacillus laterosporus]MCZ0827250.1 hypothetical protein [Brevibacillus laterosporus]MCZ0851006.1 hypothetical protein [Brevibacillus laterosporus]
MSREIDAKVAESLGWEVKDESVYINGEWTCGINELKFSSTGNGMLLLIEEIRNKLWWNLVLISHLRALSSNEGHEVHVFDCHGGDLASHQDKESAPRAVSLAYLKARGVDITSYVSSV